MSQQGGIGVGAPGVMYGPGELREAWQLACVVTDDPEAAHLAVRAAVTTELSWLGRPSRLELLAAVYRMADAAIVPPEGEEVDAAAEGRAARWLRSRALDDEAIGLVLSVPTSGVDRRCANPDGDRRPVLAVPDPLEAPPPDPSEYGEVDDGRPLQPLPPSARRGATRYEAVPRPSTMPARRVQAALSAAVVALLLAGIAGAGEVRSNSALHRERSRPAQVKR